MILLRSYGRRNAFIFSSFITVALMVASPFSPNYWVYAGLRFVIGMSSGGVLVVGIVIVLEVVGPQHRDIAGIFFLIKRTNALIFVIIRVFGIFGIWPTYVLCRMAYVKSPLVYSM